MEKVNSICSISYYNLTSSKKGMEKKDLDFLPQVLSITFAFVNESRVV